MKTRYSPLELRIRSSLLCIFDLDGTLVNLEDLNFQSFQAVIQTNLHKELSNQEYQQYFSGRGSLTGFQKYLEVNKSPITEALQLQQDFIQRKRKALTTNFHSHVQVIKGATEFLKALQEIGIHRGLATSTGREFSALILKNTHLGEYFEHVLDREDVQKIKPDPEIYQRSLEHFGCSPDNAIIFEDSINGIEAAHAAQVYCVGIRTSGKNDTFVTSADTVIDSYQELEIRD